MTRPRIFSSTSVCRIVLLAVTPCIMPNPVTNIMEHREPQVRESQSDEADAEDRGSDRNHLQEAAHGSAHDEGQGGNERSHPHGTHQKPESVRTAVQHLGREDGHEHHEGPSHEADQREQQEDGADRKRRDDVVPTLAQLHDHRRSGGFSCSCWTRIISSDAMTAM